MPSSQHWVFLPNSKVVSPILKLLLCPLVLFKVFYIGPVHFLYSMVLGILFLSLFFFNLTFIIFSNVLLLVHKKATGFCIILSPALLLNSLIVYNSFTIDSHMLTCVGMFVKSWCLFLFYKDIELWSMLKLINALSKAMDKLVISFDYSVKY